MPQSKLFKGMEMEIQDDRQASSTQRVELLKAQHGWKEKQTHAARIQRGHL